jgi:probable F420-dependent oxidoreductase
MSPGPVALATMVEDAGVDSIWVPDHLCIPRSRSTPYPYSNDGEFPFPEETPWLDSLTVLAAIAAATDRVRLGTAILVLTQRNPQEVAKVTSSLDRLSDGRLRLGVGAGWLKEEIRALGYETRHRGRRLDEAIEIIRDCWTGETHRYDGDELSVEGGLIFMPTPAQQTIPVLVGGSGTRAKERAAELGDGWIPGAAIDMLDFDLLARGKSEIAERRADLGRQDAPFEYLLVVDTPSHHADELPGVARRLQELGFDEMIIDLPFEDTARARATLTAVRKTLAS